MRACQRRRNSNRSSLGDIGLLAALAVEIEREPGHAFYRTDRQSRAHDAVYVAVEAVPLREFRLPELVQEGGLTDLLPAAFAINQHAHVVYASADHDEPCGDRLFLAGLLEDPHGLAPVVPIALS